MAKPNQRTLNVLQSVRLTPNMQRITLGGSQLAGFPPDQSSAYVKLSFACAPRPSESFRGRVRKLLHRKHSVLRSYTIRRHDPQSQTLDIDFVLHGEGGPAAQWARVAEPGRPIRIAGPGPKKLVDMGADWFLMAGDMSALPAIAANLEQMPRDARGYVVLEIMENGDRQTLDAPEGITVDWVVNSRPNRPTTMLLDAVRAIPWLEGEPSIWVAGELNAVRSIRSYLKTASRVDRRRLYVSSYWQMGRSDEEHRVEKARDRD